ncbi:hypothetical protein GSF08_04160 [Clostridiaceae bacterium DONG20-135]|uniref:Uncharacterized protein n=2 Tax=Copranaerobaculum intestinale TaxID=2692629 RepID=A0A6N8UBS7_9FIRM|nr:hypothetical protein [Copranaerobaculum intestinale]
MIENYEIDSKTFLNQMDQLSISVQKAMQMMGESISVTMSDLASTLDRTIQYMDTFASSTASVSDAQSTAITSITLFNGVMGMLSATINIANTCAENFNLAMLASPYVIVATAIAGVVSALGVLSSFMGNEISEHQRAMDAINKEIDARNDLKSKQEEQLAANLSEAVNIQGLNNELNKLVNANGEVKAGYEDRAAFIISTLNSALGEQIKIENGVVTGYDNASGAIDNKIAKLRAEAVLEAELPIYKKALIELSEAQVKADKLESEMSELKTKRKAKEAELEAEYHDNWRQKALEKGDLRLAELSQLELETDTKQEQYDQQNKLIEGYYDDISLYETNAALIASGNAENYAKVQMESAVTKAQSVEEKKIALQKEIDAETDHIDYLKELKNKEKDEEKQRQIQAQIEAEELKLTGYQNEIDGFVEQGEKIAELGKIKNNDELSALETFINSKQEKLIEMNQTESSQWTEQQQQEAADLQKSITDNLKLYTDYADKKILKAKEKTAKLNENSTQEEKDAAAAAEREAANTLEILGQNAIDKLNVLEDLKQRKKNGESGITDDMIEEAARQAKEAEKGYKKVANKVEGSFKDLPESSRKIFGDVMIPMLDEMQKKEEPLFKKADRIAGGILDRLKKSFDIHSPSRKVRQIFQYVMEGAKIGLDDRTPELLKQTDAISSDVLESFLNLDVSEVNRMVDKMQDAFHRENFKINGLIQSSYSHELMTTGKLHVDVPELKATLKGNLENHISIDGRETAVALTPFISEEIAFQGGL